MLLARRPWECAGRYHPSSPWRPAVSTSEWSYINCAAHVHIRISWFTSKSIRKWQEPSLRRLEPIRRPILTIREITVSFLRLSLSRNCVYCLHGHFFFTPNKIGLACILFIHLRYCWCVSVPIGWRISIECT